MTARITRSIILWNYTRAHLYNLKEIVRQSLLALGGIDHRVSNCAVVDGKGKTVFPKPLFQLVYFLRKCTSQTRSVFFMSLYHLHCDIIGRSGGRSATAAAAYRATCKIEDRTTGETFDFSRKEKALFSEILTNGNAPEWATDRTELWNSVEEKENRKNSQFCRSFDIALMKEFDLETNLKLVRKWAKDNYINRGLVADICIHAPHKKPDGTTNENIHAHILIPTRKMNSEGWTEKDREANDREFLRNVRTSWADIVNAEFERKGMSERIDERTLEEQGIDREPQQHQGPKATAMERKGKSPDRKKYKSQEQTQRDIAIDEILLESALNTDEEYRALKIKRAEATEQNELEKNKLYQREIVKLQSKTKNEILTYEQNTDRAWKALSAVHIIQQNWTDFYQLAFDEKIQRQDTIELVNTLNNDKNFLKPSRIAFDPKNPFSHDFKKAVNIRPRGSEEYKTQINSADKVVRIAERNPDTEFSQKLNSGISSWLEKSPLAKPYRTVKKAIKFVIDKVRYVITKPQKDMKHEKNYGR